MEYPPLVDASTLGTGAPSQDDLDTMADDIRAYCGWHIAPVVTETITLDSDGQEALVLPTLKLQDVTAVRYWDGTTMAPLGGWNARTGWSTERCSIYRAGGFPRGRRAIEVDIVHGYANVPPALVKGILKLTTGPGPEDVASESLPGHAVTFRGDTPATATATVLASYGALARYKLGPRP